MMIKDDAIKSNGNVKWRSLILSQKVFLKNVEKQEEKNKREDTYMSLMEIKIIMTTMENKWNKTKNSK